MFECLRQQHEAVCNSQSRQPAANFLEACGGPPSRRGQRRSEAVTAAVMRTYTAFCVALLAFVTGTQAAERLRFWNLTAGTVTHLSLAPAGTTDWGPNQCRNDPDGAVDHDERLTLKDVVPGIYDVRLADNQGRVCVVRNVEVEAGKPYAFAISESDLKDCSK